MMIQYILLGYITFMTVVAACSLKRGIDPLYFLESFKLAKTMPAKCPEVREKKDDESTLRYLRSVSQNNKDYSDILKCNL